MKEKLYRSIVALILAVFTILILFWWLGLSSTRVSVKIDSGASSFDIASKLHKLQIISNTKFFLILARLSGTSDKLRAGTYTFSPRDSVFSILKRLTEGRANYVKVTVPEGYTSRQIAEQLASLGIVSDDEFLKIVDQKKLEGYLFPETYLFEAPTQVERVINKMVSEVDKIFTDEIIKNAAEIKINKHNVLVLASIVQREAANVAEMPHIAAIFHNRLKKRWYLESCATVLYALGKHKERLMYKDLEVNSPFNTYQHLGLPPGPICNPGKDAIKAVLYPDSTEDMFFAVNSSGTHSFSRYYSEHLINKRKIPKSSNTNRK